MDQGCGNIDNWGLYWMTRTLDFFYLRKIWADFALSISAAPLQDATAH